MSSWVRETYDLEGAVQGVGFRPALHRLAVAAGLGGWIQNRTGVVRLVLEGSPDRVTEFMTSLPGRLPPQARLDRVTKIAAEAIDAPARPPAFAIRASEAEGEMQVAIPADLAICPSCRRELHDPANRRFRHPFITCCDCGPRYTVVEQTPYDRARTTMRVFPLCPACAAEYGDPADRRFHAESISCPACGPRLWLADCAGRRIDGDAIPLARRALADGCTVAVRGLGGYLLAVNALDRAALAELRRRKRRPHKPFAVMAPDLDGARRWCLLPDEAAAALASARAPIVILDLRAPRDPALPADLLTPDAPTLGMMLPTTPVHELLFAPGPGDPVPPFALLVMTSGNRGGEPVCISNDEAIERLAGIADFFLMHDREINLRNDDSLVVPRGGGVQVWRRARGHAPEAVRLARPLRRRVLAYGAGLKNTIAVGRGGQVVLSPHIGDLEAPEAVESLRRTAGELPRFLAVDPEVIAVDLHPDLPSTRLGRAAADAAGLPVMAVQHHHAHALACMAEHGLDECLALAFDGTGYGTDGSIWGAELLHVALGGPWRRLATFAAVPLPGGDAAVLDPRRQLAARWIAAGVEPPAARRAGAGIGDEEWEIWGRQVQAGIHAPPTHAAGRLFDAAAAALGIAPRPVTYEGQTAIRLESAARAARGDTDDLRIRTLAGGMWMAGPADGLFVVDWSPLFERLAGPVAPADRGPWALAFHHAVADAAEAMVRSVADAVPCRTVALTGGVFMNRILCDLLPRRLADAGFAVVQHRAVPPNDGGVALGQVMAAGM